MSVSSSLGRFSMMRASWGAFVDADTATDAEALGDVRFAGVLIHDDAFLPVSDRRAEDLAFIVALLRLTIVFLQNGNTHFIT